MKKIVTILAATLLATLVGCASSGSVTSLRGTDVAAADPAADPARYTEAMPGTGSALIARTFTGQPPLIPHTMGNYEEISFEENPCLDCHITDEFKGKPMPKMGASHFVKGVKDKAGDPVVDMARWQCNSCHVPQANAKPLVDNSFVGHIKKQ